jgi:hypothetical protein
MVNVKFLELTCYEILTIHISEILLNSGANGIFHCRPGFDYVYIPLGGSSGGIKK